MAIVCVQCGLESETLYFRRPAKPKEVRILRGALLLAGLLSVVNMATLTATMLRLVRESLTLRNAVLQHSGPRQAAARDLARIFANASILLTLVLIAATLAIAVRYLTIFLQGFRRGRPRTWDQLRFIAWAQLLLEAISFVGLGVVFIRTETMHFTPSLGFGILIAPTLLWLTSRPPVKRYFSTFRVDAFDKAPVGINTARAA
jgi:hypothetical protein